MDHTVSLADQVAALEADRDEWCRRALEAEETNREIALRMYRRGYLAGHHAKRAGRPQVTNPERHARGELRRLLT